MGTVIGKMKPRNGCANSRNDEFFAASHLSEAKGQVERCYFLEIYAALFQKLGMKA